MSDDPAPPRRSRSAALTWLALACALVVLVVAVAQRRDRPVSDRTVGEVTRVGVTDGASIPAYLRAAGDELARLDAPDGYALVSFGDYLTPARAAAALDGTRVSAVVARVPLPGRQTEIVRIAALRLPQDVVAGMTGVATRKDREAADYRSRAAAAAADPELRRAYDSGAEVAAREAEAYRAGCACVYAAVVGAAPDALRALAGRPGVRVVDPAPEVTRLDRTVFTPPLPEQRDVVRPPADTGPAEAGGMGDSSEAARTVSGPSPTAPASVTGSGAPNPAPTS
ncbi:hypothetical protein J5U46_10495 [Micromonospora tulbaghiae]|uniref:Uncharacterized protein n=1 Tax=Micromonospora tulbaghiae TaxID=479978 RepID=A0AAW4JF12_9ACTN|nr:MULTISPECIES: hypothetical protein [Micromonospora]KAB1906029.1 hypothetical protein F8279_15665 [Micromonospora sp. AMSO1212t]MBO4140573.1 hypothetical protein [Micromonospora tulbaghiae]MDX5457795.1 hypothetical protein [Micromonospora tulbaghiae]SCE88329.1 hypothetical protein GA0070562_3721 [Micromonospora tulbaghiae]